MKLTIEDLQEDLVDRLRERASRHARSLEAEITAILADAASRPADDVVTRLDRFRESLRGRVSGDSTDIIRAARDAGN